MKLRLQVDEAVRGFPDTCPWPKLGCVGLRAPGSLSDPIFPTPGWLPLAVFQMYFWSQFVCVPCQNLCHSLSLSLFADGGWTTCSTSTRRFTEIPLGKSSIVIDGHNLDDSVIFDFQVWFHWHRVRTHSLSYSGLPLRYLDSLSLSDSSSFCLFLQKKKKEKVGGLHMALNPVEPRKLHYSLQIRGTWPDFQSQCTPVGEPDLSEVGCWSS